MKKRIILFIFLIISPFLVHAYPLGDVDGNNDIDIRDYGKIKMHLLNRLALTGDELKRADIDGINGVDSRDLGLELKLVLGEDISKYINNATSKPTVTFTPTPTNTPKPTPTPTSKPTATPTPTPKPTPTPTPKPTNTPVVVKNYSRIHYISNGTYIVPSNSAKGASTANSIVLESNGHFALIDTGLANNDAENPGHATKILNYLKKIGATKLDFLIMTHGHYDHIGGLSTIVDSIQIDHIYIKPYYSYDRDGNGDQTMRVNYATLLSKYFGSSFSCNDACLKSASKYRTAIKTVDGLYNQVRTNVGARKMTSTLHKVNASSEGMKLTLGNMTITLYNTTNIPYHKECYGTSSSEFNENSNSIVSYVTVGSRKALIVSDLAKITQKCYTALKYNNTLSCSSNNCSILSYIAKKIKSSNKINLDYMDIAHHGYSSCDMNTSVRDRLNPSYIVVPNWKEKVDHYYAKNGPYSSGESCLTKYFNSSQYKSHTLYVGSRNLVIDFTNNGFSIYDN